jgi:hypothetical protein
MRSPFPQSTIRGPARRRLARTVLTTALSLCSISLAASDAAPGDTGQLRTVGFAELSRAFVALAIQGDLRPAVQLFDHAVGAGDAGAALRAQFDERFVSVADTPVSPDDADLAEGVARAYRAYWRHNLMREAAEPESERRLSGNLAMLLQGTDLPTAHDPDELTRIALGKAGLYFSASSTPPWRDLFVWGRQHRAAYRVELTDVTVPVEVVFMDEFVLQGWKDFASLGLASTSGWVENGTLYCVTWAYDTQSENFAVSYLKHEARHLADLARFPRMDTTELEYRAKLTELAFANLDLERIWNDFRAKASNNPDSPHAMANWRVVRDVEHALAGSGMQQAAGRLNAADARQLGRAARRLLLENTRAHERGIGATPR